MFAEILKGLRKSNGLTQTEFAKKFHIATGTIAMWETGKRQPDTETVKRIADFFGVSVDFLLGRSNTAMPERNAIRIPVLGYVAAGIPIDAIEDVLDYEELDPERFNSDYQYFGLKIKGDSMTPRIHDGDVVIVRRQPDVESGDVAIVCINGSEATCKQVKKHTEGVTLVSYNASYEPMFFTNHEVNNLPVTVLGKVVELRGKF